MTHETKPSRLNLDFIYDLPLDGTTKGVPGGNQPLKLSEIGGKGWNILNGDLPFPVAVLKQTALENNRRWMTQYASKTDVLLAPHGKTTMAPQLFDMQLEDGVWGITAATSAHIQVYRRFGVDRILLANQLVGRNNIRSVLKLLQDDTSFEFYCLIDSLENLSSLLQALQETPIGRPLRLLLEIGAPGGRTGVRRTSSAMRLAKAVKAAEPLVALCGIEAYEGIFDVTEPDNQRKADELLTRTLDVAAHCDKSEVFADGPIILTAGGTTYFDQVVQHFDALDLQRPVDKIIRSGCYLTHDEGYYRRAHKKISDRIPVSDAPGFMPQPALEVITVIQSLPEDGRAIAAAGKRDVSFDMDLPTPLWRFRASDSNTVQSLVGRVTVTALNDQHAYLDLSKGIALATGDIIGMGVSHPCTTFDRWSLIYVVDDDYNVVDAVKTFF